MTLNKSQRVLLCGLVAAMLGMVASFAQQPTPPGLTELESVKLENIQLAHALIQRTYQDQMSQLTAQADAYRASVIAAHTGWLQKWTWNSATFAWDPIPQPPTPPPASTPAAAEKGKP